MRRHKLVFVNYLKVIKRLGSDAKNVSKTALYDEAGEPLGLDAMTSGRIIRSALKQDPCALNRILSDIEATDILEVLLGLNK